MYFLSVFLLHCRIPITKDTKKKEKENKTKNTVLVLYCFKTNNHQKKIIVFCSGMSRKLPIITTLNTAEAAIYIERYQHIVLFFIYLSLQYNTMKWTTTRGKSYTFTNSYLNDKSNNIALESHRLPMKSNQAETKQLNNCTNI